MKKGQFKSQASSGRAGGFGGGFGGFGGSTQSSVLSYVQEPPDYSNISDSHVVVAFKNLTKKDGTTKAKALEDLQASLISGETGIEDGVVEAWVKQYPRLSIDNARRVRQLSHQLTGQIGAKLGKRIAKQLPKIVGPWLAGTFDVDRSVSKAAQDALASVFPSSEKVQGLRNTFHESIITYCKEAVLNETVGTLSDERSVSPDDAKATYARVVSSAIAVISSLVDSLSPEELSKQSSTYDRILGEKKLWELSSYEDSSVRKALHRLIQTCLQRERSLIENNQKLASNAYVYKGLASDQTGSALDFVSTLHALTIAFPDVWTTAYSGKKPALSRLRQCLKSGAHAGPAGYWDIMADLLRKLPSEVLPTSYDDIADLLLATRDGVSKKEERFNASSAWPTYFSLLDMVTQQTSDEDCENLLEAFAMPPINQYLHPCDESAKWSITGSKAASLVARVTIVKRLPPLLERKWKHLGDKLIEVAKMSQPEQSKDFDKSQKHVATVGERWAALQRELYSSDYGFLESLKQVFANVNTSIAGECISLLRTRNGKPYGAAAVLEEQLRNCGSYLLSEASFVDLVRGFVTEDAPRLVYSPSQKHVVRCLYAVHPEPWFAAAFQAVLGNALDSEEPETVKIGALRSLFPPNTPPSVIQGSQGSRPLQEFLSKHTSASAEAEHTALFSELLGLGVVSQDTSDAVLSGMTQKLSLSGDELLLGLSALDQVAVTNESAVRAFMSGTNAAGEQLLSSVLRLEQSPQDEVAERATALSSRLTSSMVGASANTKYGVILQNLERMSASSLPIGAVIDLAGKVIGEGKDVSDASELLPPLDIWREAILATTRPPKASLALLSPLGGAIHLVEPAIETKAAHYDAEGLSQALRIAMYYASVLTSMPHILPQSTDKATLLALLNICILLAEDNTSIAGANGLWKSSEDMNLDIEVMEFVSNANQITRTYWEETGADVAAPGRVPFYDALESLRKDNAGTPMAYYAALTFTKSHDNFFELNGYSADQSKTSEEKLRTLRSAKNTMDLVAYIVGFAQPLTGGQFLSRLCNETVADLTAMALEADQARVLESLVLLNQILHTQPDEISTVAKNRIVFLVKHIIPWLKTDAALEIKAEVCKSLSHLLAGMADMYGEHWTDAIESLVEFWNNSSSVAENGAISESSILVIHATLKLYATLRKLARGEEPNDDLVDALKQSEDILRGGLVVLLQSVNGIPDQNHQPLMVTNELLARQISQLPAKPIKDAEELFPLLYTPSQAILGAAFELLHQHIPQAQEQISFDAALEAKKANLPDELLSLLIDAPTLDSLADASFDTTMPLSLQGYLYSWRLVFDHFTGSSYRVKGDYIEQLKEDGCLNGLLALTFDFLGHTRGRPVDASSFDIQNYTPNQESSPEKDVQSLLTHLYYLSLANLPSLVKHYLNNEIRSRQAPKTIEAWTAKYISPLIVTSSLEEVSQWNEKNVKSDPDYEAMTIKVNTRGREVLANYMVDEQTMAMKIVLPEAYPIQNARAEGINRVAVSEQKWRSWLLNCQGTIAFSNGSIIDALTNWRKNVTGALKGQSECAICYSIINDAKELPTKRCPTCKQMFHNQCLFKWFRSSNSSTCPLCRQQYRYN
ncbi:E3 ubiquitin-protein ligase listerin [Pseudocercospora fuligena]|uniref:E3 ubiquitin-protein ligase listerin n=1 Tax=Pseudocercospora fuligena TaxID=685502 RepID=A0A8H6VR17_9PEZI|nr:E3 ubiquitin-protein ligase listerin [Pseudocercospora fuligena]